MSIYVHICIGMLLCIRRAALLYRGAKHERKRVQRTITRYIYLFFVEYVCIHSSTAGRACASGFCLVEKEDMRWRGCAVWCSRLTSSLEAKTVFPRFRPIARK